MTDFVAIDFETANGCRSSVCSVGIVIVHNGEIVDRFYSLIKPTPNYYTYWTTEVHGLTRQDTDKQPIFPEVWAQIAPRIEGLPLIAHNSPFDESCLKAVFEEYGMDYPGYEFHCTLAASRRCLDLPNHQLHISAAACGFDMENHHHALCEPCSPIQSPCEIKRMPTMGDADTISANERHGRA
ncbi:MAG: 3'-5' exonuclease [Muribaculaceae bacterium]|nr:3'-5' exonuclease [Muribaculaceae bacterium]MDE6753576.1 3'-5' exonuclease [Muribaculaceae bacterium]